MYLRAENKQWFINRVEVAGLYWHFVDLVWIFLFSTLYLTLIIWNRTFNQDEFKRDIMIYFTIIALIGVDPCHPPFAT